MEPLVVAAAEIGRMLGIKRARVFQLVTGPDFPAPVARLSMGKVWLREDVAQWAERCGRPVFPLSDG